jgi:FkbM family methyltransferase
LKINISNWIKNFVVDYFVPGIILVGLFLLFLILSSVLFSIKRFYIFVALFFAMVCFVVSMFVVEHKIVRIIRGFVFVFCVVVIGTITKLTISDNNPWALYYKIRSISDAAQNVYYKERREGLPSRSELFSTFVKLEGKSFLIKSRPYGEKIFGLNLNFSSYEDLAHVFQGVFIDQDYFVHLDTANPKIIDCGSNEGLSILFFKMVYPKSKVLGFEAHPKNFENLQNNIETSQLSEVTLFNKAVYNTQGKLVFSSSNSIGSKVLKEKGQNDIYVDSVLLSSYIDKPIDLLKMDIEGAESPVIEELDKNKKLKFVKNIVMEFHFWADKNYNNFDKTISILRENGFAYKISKVDKNFGNSIIHAYKS